MATEFSVENLIHLIFFALFALIAIFLISTLWSALFPQDNVREDLANRIEFTACGAHYNTEEKMCPGNQPASNLFIAEANDIHERVIIFERANQVVESPDILIWDNEGFLGLFPTALRTLPNLPQTEFVNPCDGPCVCIFDLGDSYLRQRHCSRLDFDGEEIRIETYQEANTYTRTKTFLSELFSEEKTQYTTDRQFMQKPAIIAPLPATWWNFLSGATIVTRSIQDSKIMTFLLHIEYVPEPEPTLRIFPYDPAFYMQAPKV